jgi:transaldolase
MGERGQMKLRPAVFLDRDGVLNMTEVRDGKPFPPADAESLIIIPEAAEALGALKVCGFVLVCVTNQPDVARGTRSLANVEAMNRKVRDLLPLDDLWVCLHDNNDHCPCRKPKPGMLLAAAEKWSIDLAQSWMIGDRAGDVAAGQAAGCRTVFLDRGYDEARPIPAADYTCQELGPAAAHILDYMEIDKMNTINDLKIKLFADGADKTGMLEMYANPLIKGFTTNPTLMRKAGIRDYEAFAREIIAAIPDRPLSFEVFSDEFDEMERQARYIGSWGDNVYVKIPVTNSRGITSAPLVTRLAASGVKQNVTALTTLSQVRDVVDALAGGPSAYVSIFAGRVADTGRDPMPLMAAAVEILRPQPQLELIWASPRELWNVFQADAVGCHIITATNDILKKLALVGKDLTEYSLDTVKMFKNDAEAAGFKLSVG